MVKLIALVASSYEAVNGLVILLEVLRDRLLSLARTGEEEVVPATGVLDSAGGLVTK